MIDDERARAAREHELRNQEVIVGILVSGSDSEMKELQALNGLSDEQMESMRYWARLRDEVHQERQWPKGKKTDEEEELGVYVDHIEPQVLGAVRTLRAKGYKTRYSGFEHFGSVQTIWLKSDQSILLPLPEVTKSEIEERYGVTISFEPGKIWIECTTTRLTVEDLKQMWDTIAEAIPPFKAEK